MGGVGWVSEEEGPSDAARSWRRRACISGAMEFGEIMLGQRRYGKHNCRWKLQERVARCLYANVNCKETDGEGKKERLCGGG